MNLNGGLRVLAPRFKPPAGLEHQFVDLVRLGILGQEVLPDAAAKKPALPGSVGRALGLFDGQLQFTRGRRGKRPLHHFLVGGGGEINPPYWRMGIEKARHCRGLQPRRCAFDLREESREPAVGIAMLVGAGPNTELLAVVAHGEES